MTTVPLDSTTYVTLKPEERARLQSHSSPLTRALEALYRLWLNDQSTRMTLHDQMAVAETLRPGAFFGNCESMPIKVDETGFTRVDAGRQAADDLARGRSDESMKFPSGRLMAFGGQRS